MNKRNVHLVINVRHWYFIPQIIDVNEKAPTTASLKCLQDSRQCLQYFSGDWNQENCFTHNVQLTSTVTFCIRHHKKRALKFYDASYIERFYTHHFNALFQSILVNINVCYRILCVVYSYSWIELLSKQFVVIFLLTVCSVSIILKTIRYTVLVRGPDGDGQ